MYLKDEHYEPWVALPLKRNELFYFRANKSSCSNAFPQVEIPDFLQYCSLGAKIENIFIHV